ncbi:MAG: hypothetical protein AAGG07_00670 [Planctomycetota bacterium]
MKAYLDEVELAPSSDTIAAAIDAAREEADRRGRVVIEVKADGDPLTGAQLAEPSTESGLVSEIRMRSADPRHLVHETLLEAADALEDSRDEHSSAGEAIQSGEGSAALQRIGSLLEVWQAARASLDQGSALLDTDLTSGVENAEDLIDALTAKLEELRHAVQTQDWSTVADVVSYDLEPHASEWASLLRAAAVNAAPGDQSG